MKLKHLAVVAALAAAFPAYADFQNGPNPYAVGGFSTPDSATWGGWSRGSAGSLYAEWDKFLDASYGSASDATAIADVGYSGVSNTPYLTWNSADGAWMVSPFNNLVNFNSPGLIMTTSLQSATTGYTGPVSIVMQIEQWNVGSLLNMYVNGVAATEHVQTYSANVTRPVGDVLDRMHYYSWEFASAPTDGIYNFTFTTAPWTAIAQISIDVHQSMAPVPEPETYAMLMAGLGLMGAVARRRRQLSA